MSYLSNYFTHLLIYSLDLAAGCVVKRYRLFYLFSVLYKNNEKKNKKKCEKENNVIILSVYLQCKIKTTKEY